MTSLRIDLIDTMEFWRLFPDEPRVYCVVPVRADRPLHGSVGIECERECEPEPEPEPLLVFSWLAVEVGGVLPFLAEPLSEAEDGWAIIKA